MTPFVTKEVLNLRSVGEILRVKRLEVDRSLEEVSFATGVGRQYLLALENDQFEKIPGSLYVKQFLRLYSEYLGMGGMSQVLFDRVQNTIPTPTLVKRVSLKELMVFSKIMRYGAAFGALGIMLMIALVQLYSFVTPPHVDLAEPISFTNHRLIAVSGSAKNARTIVVNNEKIPVDDHGYFSTMVPLVEGINALNVFATSRHGETSETQATVYYARQVPAQQLSAR